jgi:hypothetical protein
MALQPLWRIIPWAIFVAGKSEYWSLLRHIQKDSGEVQNLFSTSYRKAPLMAKKHFDNFR